MTDIVGSTEHAAEMGDSAWRELVQLHHQRVRAALRAHGGREIDTAGDGFFAIFDAPAAAILCALQIVAEVAALGLEVRAGVHVGEVEQIGRKVGGIAVPIAARIMAAAESGQVLVSGTARDLAAGAGLKLEPRGVHQLKGVPGEWQLYAATSADTVAGMVATDAGSDAASRRAAAVRRAQARPIWQRRPRLAAALVLGLAIVVATAGLLVWKPWQPRALAAIAENSVGVVDVGRGEIIHSIPVEPRPGGIAIADGIAWVSNTGADAVSQIDMATRTTRRVIDVGRAPVGIAVVDGSVWVANSGARTVTRINAETARVVSTTTVGNGPQAVAGHAGSVWVANLNDSSVVRIDAESGEVAEPIPVAAGPVALAADESGIWVISADVGIVTHLDGGTGATVAAPIQLPSRPTAVAAAAGAVWVASSDGTVTRIDPVAHRVTATIDVGGVLSAIAVGSDGVWVADRQGYVTRLDTANPAVGARRITTTSAPEAIALADAQVWIAAHPAAASHRGGTLRAVGPVLPEFDPIGFYEITHLQADGLLAYRRVGGAAGNTLVPSLATAIPRSTDGGRTYTFQLRSGLEYSTGESVRPADFRRAIERSFQIAHPFLGVMGPYLFPTIMGAEECIEPDSLPVARCDLSPGIVTDEAANTITFRLSEPDPSFLNLMAGSLAYPVPEGVPMNSLVEGSFPGTGPYVVSAHDESGVRLTRNPNFTPWSTEARPDGFPDEIVWTLVADPAEAVAMVERGDADFMQLGLRSRPEPEVLARLGTQLPGQLHVGRNSVTSISFNAELAPFDNPAARQAVSMAVDRAHVVDLHGGPGAAAVTCQVLPPGWPAYTPYCPYTTHTDAGGQWQAPDLDAARRLVDESGTRGAEVVVGPVLPFFSDTRDYVVEVLKELGYAATADTRTDEEYVFAAHFEENRVQASVWLWLLVSLSPYNFLSPFTCGNPGQFGTTNFCDPAYDALVTEASELQLRDPAAAAEKWAEAERMIVDLAVWAPLMNEGSDFVSARVGNYQFHPYYLALLDQMWVVE